MIKTISAIAVAAVIAAALTALPGQASNPVAAVKSDRADIAECDTQGWPYYNKDCLRDTARNAGRLSKVRLVSPDRISDDAPVAPSSWQRPVDEVYSLVAAGDFIKTFN